MRKITIGLFVLVFCLSACKTTTKTTTAPGNKEQVKKPATPDPNKERIVLITTDLGNMKVKLYDATPKHRDNFVKLVQQGFYDSLLFHRVIQGFMIQGGDPQSKTAAPGVMLGNGDIGYTIPAEFVDTIFHKKGSLCAARTENPAKASSSCQFYIVQGRIMNEPAVNSFEAQRGMKLSEKQREILMTVGGTPQLDKGYTVYGEVIEGLDVIDKIAAVKTAPGDRPVQDVRMKMKLIQ